MWDNPAHRHTGLGLLTPHDVHHGLAEQRVAERAAVLATAYAVPGDLDDLGAVPAG